MNSTLKLSALLLFLTVFGTGCKSAQTPQSTTDHNIKTIQIILGSTRQGRTSPKIAQALKQIADKRSDQITEILDIKEYNLPFLDDAVSPASQTEIKDPVLKKWSDAIKQADGFIIVVPEYNSGYPGVLKNALDLLYKEWEGKPVAFVSYSGGPSGGTTAMEQLRTVTQALNMKPVRTNIKIPHAWKAFDAQGKFTSSSIESDVNTILNQLIA